MMMMMMMMMMMTKADDHDAGYLGDAVGGETLSGERGAQYSPFCLSADAKRRGGNESGKQRSTRRVNSEQRRRGEDD